ncbi:UDP-glucuronosyltransferase 2B31-like [Haliotis rubra]|uniref:UDP-glucuronosyltransferase 2B31-like n=1 Tax=Haliotis rubra TaxID=36100 RepID=UPI001EE5E580|nr:UDP-glucuronosyltransferase 2B31-like [Haliotis rubra]
MTASAVILSVLVTSWCTEAGKVLYLTFPQYSHLKTMNFAMDDLSRYGHELWTAYPDYLSSTVMNSSLNLIRMKGLGSMDVNDELYSAFVSAHDPGLTFSKFTVKVINWKNTLKRIIDKRTIPISTLSKVREINHKILTDSDMLQEIKEKRFDLVIANGDIGLPYIIIPYILDLPFCILGNSYDPWRSGNPSLPSYLPYLAHGDIGTDSMTFLQRVKNTLAYLMKLDLPPFIHESDVMTYAPDNTPITFTQLMTNAKLWMVEQDSVADYPRPLMPNTILVGGLSARDSSMLSGRFKDFYDISDSVVIVSFGGSVTTISTELTDKLQQAFSMTNYNFVWKSDKPSWNQTKCLLTKWLPQNDLLGNSKTKLFITHGGNNGYFESLYHGVPMLGVPMFADQYYNTQRLQHKGYGLALDLYRNSAEDFADAITQIVENPVFKKNVLRASKLLRDRPMNSRQQIAYWIDHVIKYGDSHIRSAGLDLPWYKYLCVDVFLVLIFILVTASLVLCKLTQTLIARVL